MNQPDNRRDRRVRGQVDLVGSRSTAIAWTGAGCGRLLSVRKIPRNRDSPRRVHRVNSQFPSHGGRGRGRFLRSCGGNGSMNSRLKQWRLLVWTLAVSATIAGSRAVYAALTDADKLCLCAAITTHLAPTRDGAGRVHCNRSGASLKAFRNAVKLCGDVTASNEAFTCGDFTVRLSTGGGGNEVATGSEDLVIAVGDDSAGSGAGDNATSTNTGTGVGLAIGGNGKSATGSTSVGGGGAGNATSGGDAGARGGDGGHNDTSGATGGAGNATTNSGTGDARGTGGDGGDPNAVATGGAGGTANAKSDPSGPGNDNSTPASGGPAGSADTHGTGGTAQSSGGTLPGGTHSGTNGSTVSNS